MFINPFEYEMYKYLDVPTHTRDAQHQAAERGKWYSWFGWRAKTRAARAA